MDYYAIGQRIRKFRKAQNLSQEALAEQANISTTHMSHIETGNTKLSLQVWPPRFMSAPMTCSLTRRRP